MIASDHEAVLMAGLSHGVMASWPHAVSLSSSDVTDRFGNTLDGSSAWLLPVEDTLLEREILVVVKSVYTPIIVALRERPRMIEMPHCDGDGILCLVSPTQNMPLPNTIEHIQYLVARVAQLLSESASGANRSDYLDEIADYWRLFSDAKKRIVYVSDSVINGVVYYTVKSSGDILVGTTADELRKWHENAYSTAVGSIRQTYCFRLEQPLFPERYPQRASDLRQLLSARQFQQPIDTTHSLGWLPVLLTFQHGDKDVLLGAIIEPGQSKQRIQLKGHRSNGLGLDRMTDTYRKLTRVSVKRVDRFTLTARTAGTEYLKFASANVVVVGCGSVGGLVATQLLQSGVGSITLIDHDVFDHQNTGRHVLHGRYIGQNKAEALGRQLGSMFPGSTITRRHSTVQRIMDTDYNSLESADLVISATGDWSSNYRMNLELVHRSRKAVLFGWTEAFAVAGHSFLSAPDCPCYCCVVDDYGRFLYNVFEDDGSGIHREDGCATMFQTFTASSVAPIASMIVRHALDYLGITFLDKHVQESELRTWVDTKDVAMSEGKIYSMSGLNSPSRTGGVHVRSFPTTLRTCAICNPT